MPNELRKWIDEFKGSDIFYELLSSGEILDLVKEGTTLELLYSDGDGWTYSTRNGLIAGYKKQLEVIIRTSLVKTVVYIWETEGDSVERSWYITK